MTVIGSVTATAGDDLGSVACDVIGSDSPFPAVLVRRTSLDLTFGPVARGKCYRSLAARLVENAAAPQHNTDSAAENGGQGPIVCTTLRWRERLRTIGPAEGAGHPSDLSSRSRRLMPC